MEYKLKTHLFVLALWSLAALAHAQGTGFSYQGHLLENGALANGAYDFSFGIFDARAAGTSLGSTLAVNAVPVSNGQFTASLDFGSKVFTGQPRWLEISVRRAGSGQFTKMDDRVSLLPTPYAIFAEAAGTVANGTVAANQLNTGGIAPAPGQVLSFKDGNLSWTDPGVATGGIWSVLNNNAYYSAGNVGVGGIAAGTSKLQITGADALTLMGAGGSYLTWRDTTTGKSAAISSTGGTLYYRVPNAAGTVVTAGYVDSNGMVTRGRLSIEGNGPYLTWADSASGRSATISSANGTLYYRVPDPSGNVVTAGYVDSNGMVTRGRLSVEGGAVVSGTMGIGTTTVDPKITLEVKSDNGYAVVGRSGFEGIHGESTSTSAGAVAGFNLSAGPGVYGKSTSGVAVYADGNASQPPDKGGLVKAMLVVNPVDKGIHIIRCFNSQKADRDASTPDCGFKVEYIQAGFYIIDFGFPVNARFVSITARYLDEDFSSNYNIGANYREDPNPDKLQVFTFHADDSKDTTDAVFTIIVF